MQKYLRVTAGEPIELAAGNSFEGEGPDAAAMRVCFLGYPV